MRDNEPNRIIVVQPALASYRLDFYNRIAEAPDANLLVYTSRSGFGVLWQMEAKHSWERDLEPIRPIAPRTRWQPGVMDIPMRRGDVVVISGAPRCISNLALVAKARSAGAHTVWWGHLWSATTKAHRFALRRAMMRLSEALLFYTDAEATTYRKLYGRNHRHVYALNNGINVDPIQSHRESYNAHKRGSRVLFIGRTSPKASLPILLEALTSPRLAKVHLEVVGDGREQDAVRDRARELGVDARITWHGGSTDEAEIAAIANRCSVFVYPGAVGLSLIHAMAYGLPALVHDRPTKHMPEIAAFTEGETGACFRMGSPESLALKLEKLLSSPEQLDTMSRIAQKRADEEYNSGVMAERFLSMVAALRGQS